MQVKDFEDDDEARNSGSWIARTAMAIGRAAWRAIAGRRDRGRGVHATGRRRCPRARPHYIPMTLGPPVPSSALLATISIGEVGGHR